MTWLVVTAVAGFDRNDGPDDRRAFYGFWAALVLGLLVGLFVVG